MHNIDAAGGLLIMVVEVDIAKLVKNLKKEKEVKPADLSDGVRYLTNMVYYTLINDMPLTVGDIDFERFTHEEIITFTAHIKNNVLKKSEKTERVYDLFDKYRPKIIKQRTFF